MDAWESNDWNGLGYEDVSTSAPPTAAPVSVMDSGGLSGAWDWAAQGLNKALDLWVWQEKAGTMMQAQQYNTGQQYVRGANGQLIPVGAQQAMAVNRAGRDRTMLMLLLIGGAVLLLKKA